MPITTSTPSIGDRWRSWDGKRTGNADDARRRQEIEERIAQRKPLRIADKVFLREVLHLTVYMRHGRDLLA